jgi:putative membrane protein
MSRIILGSLTIAVLSVAAACTADTNTNANINRANMNSNTAIINSNANAMNSNTMNGNMNTADNKVSNTADVFMTAAAQGGMMEVELGKLASTKAQNAEVKAFGKKMVEDHTKANTELKALAAKKNVELPKEMSGAQKAEVERLSKLSGAEFDREYVKLMVDDHDEDLEAFQEQADDAEDADVKAFAAKHVPILKTHYEMIKAINDKME